MKEDPYRLLSWDDLIRWAGKNILDRGKNYRSQVTDLAVCEDGQLMATVQGQDHYLTQVWFGDDGLQYRCTCPYWAPCKHAVAVVLVYLDRTGSGQAVPEIAAEEFEAAAEAYRLIAIPEEEPGSRIDPEKVRAALEQLSKKEIIEWAVGTIAGDPGLWESLPPGLRLDDLRNKNLGKPEITAKQIARIRQEIRRVTRTRVWRNDWDGRDYSYDEDGPDYSSIEWQFQNLLDAGHTETLIELGEELFELGHGQLEESDDEGEIATQLTNCMKLVFEAMRRSDGPAPEQLIRYWDMLSDDFGLLDEIPPPVNEAKMTKADWLQVAGEFMGRLDPSPGQKKEDRIASRYWDYRRNRVLDCAVEALVKAGDNDRAVELMVSELPRCGNYVGLVDHLLKSGDHELAERWARKGFQQTIKTDSHIAMRLARKLQEVAAKQKNKPQVAALEAEFFFMAPDTDQYRNTRKVCRQSGHWDRVRPFLLRYLETGDGVWSDAGWPLPKTGLGFPEPEYQKFPDWGSLISVALDEKRSDDAVRWYRQAPSGQVSSTMTLAGAVKKTHPDVALDIWKERIESLISTVKVKAYREAMRPLEDVRSLMRETEREEEYQAYVVELRKHHRAKRKLMEELDFLEQKHRKILDG